MIQIARRILVGLLMMLACCSAFGKGPRDRKAASDIQRLQGTWIADLEPGLQGRLVLDKSRLQFSRISKQQETIHWEGQFAINEQASPKQMDWTPLRRNNRNLPANLAIYHLEGDFLLIIGNTEGPRPTAFYSGGGTQRPKTVIYRRAQNKVDR